MEGEDAKNNLFFVGENRFKYYIIEPLNELISVVNTGINNYYWNPDNLQISTRYNDKQQIEHTNHKMAENNNRINIKPIESKNTKYQDILYLTFEDLNRSDKLQYEFKFNNDIDINNLIRLKSNIQTYHLINVDGNAYEQQNMDIVIPISIFENIFKTHSYINKSKLPITCYFAITPELTNEININKSKEFGHYFYQLLNDKKLNYIFMSDVKQCHEFVGYFLLELCLSKKIESGDDENNIIKFFNDIYVLPCLHDIKDRAGTINSYFDMKTDCRNNPSNDENYNFIDSSEKNKLINDYTQDVSKKRKKDCTNIVIECGVNKTIQHYNINWSIYNDFYAHGYRDQNKRGRRLCRESNFLGIFFDNFVVTVRRIGAGGKKYRKSRKLKRSRKHKSRKYKNKSRK
jgi:hypothetical protein